HPGEDPVIRRMAAVCGFGDDAEVKPFVVCHMMPSLDGRLRTDRWDIPEATEAEYDRTANTYRPDAWLVGRVTMEEFADGRWRGPRVKRKASQSRPDFVARKTGERWAVALDSAGKLAWKTNTTEGDSVIVALSGAVPDAYLEYLRRKGISYLFAGDRPGKLNLHTVITKLREKWAIRRLLVEGGGKTTGAFLAAGLVDEISLLLTPVADGGMAEPALFDTVGQRGPKALTSVRIRAVRKVGGGAWWLKARPLNRRG
ncbi:MAG TPA: dihydrofolate reductase family protein, partial [Lacunisphaera sp.]|nr:dihydrofolate reductase family protein [Lacunisphaera sp.]